MVSTDAPIRAGLIFQQRQSAEQLKRTLREAGIDLAVELDVDALRAGQLDEVEVEVYIVNLETEIEDLLDEVTELLEGTVRPVVYNDAGVSSDLSGWDQARWARHLAAKIRKGRDTLPPAPAGSQSIPSPHRAEPAVAAAALVSTDNAEAAPEVVEAGADPAASVAAASDEVLVSLDSDASFDLAELPDFDPPDIDTRGEDTEAEVAPFEDTPPPIEPAELDPNALELDFGDLATDALAVPSTDKQGLAADWPTETDSEAELETGQEASTVAAEVAFEQVEMPDQPSSDDSLELDLDLPDELFGGEDLQVGGEALQVDDEPVDALADLDDLSAFDEMTDGDSDLLEVLDAPESNAGESFDTDDLESLFNDELDLGDDTGFGALEAATDASDSDAPEMAIAIEETDVSLMLEELPDIGDELAGDSRQGGEVVADLDELFAAAPTGDIALPTELIDTATTDAGGGFSLPDISEWVLEPLDESLEAQAAAVAAPKAESTGLDLRDLDSPVRQPAPVAEPKPAPAQPLSSPASSVPASDATDLASLDMGIDFVDFDLAPLDEAPPSVAAPAAQAQPEATPETTAAAGPKRIVILGASIGGPDSIRAFLKDIKPDLHAAFVLVQHMGAEFLDLMAQQLDRVSPLRVHLASQGRSLNEGEVLIAPVGKRLKFDANAAVDLSEDAGSTAYSPSIDQVLSDGLQRWGADRLLVIIFSGMANDAVAGARQLAAAGVPIWAQDPASCVISSMVDGVVAAKVVSFIGTPEQLAAQANRLLA